MTGRDLLNMLMDIEDLDAECVILTDEEGNDRIIDVEIEVSEEEYDDYEDDNALKPGTIVIIPTEFE